MLAAQYEKVHNIDITHNITEQENIVEDVQNYLEEDSYYSKDTSDLEKIERYLTSPGELKQIITTLPAHKAPGDDQIQNIVLKNLSKKAIV